MARCSCGLEKDGKTGMCPSCDSADYIEVPANEGLKDLTSGQVKTSPAYKEKRIERERLKAVKKSRKAAHSRKSKGRASPGMVFFNWALVLFLVGGGVYFAAIAPPVDWDFGLSSDELVAEVPAAGAEDAIEAVPSSNRQCGLIPATTSPTDSVVLERDPLWANSTGPVEYLVLFVEFPDRPASRTVQSLREAFSPAVEDFFAAESYGRLDFQFDFFSRWLVLPKPFENYSAYTQEEWTELVADAFRVADIEVDFSRYEGVIVITDPSHSPVSRGFAFFKGNTATRFDGVQTLRGVVSSSGFFESTVPFFVHEVLHTMGLKDLYAYGGGFEDNATDVRRFTGDFSIMGASTNMEMLGFEKWSLGWISDSQVFCEVSGVGEFNIAPLSSSTGKRLAVLSLSDVKSLVIEYRDVGGALGVLTYLVDASVPGGQGPIQVLVKSDGLPSQDNSLLKAGDEISTEGRTIIVDILDEEVAKVRVLHSF